jgi:hypothetical protein
MAKTYRLDLFVRQNSTATEQQAKDYALKWANDRTNASDNKDNTGALINAYYIDVTDLRTSKKWMVFGYEALKVISGGNPMDSIVTILDPTQFLRGYSKDIAINTEDGKKSEGVSNPHRKDFTAILTVKDSLQAEVRVENETLDGFDIALYDGSMFTEDNVTIDCSGTPITVNETVIFL